jgi:two-component system response regulator RegX3
MANSKAQVLVIEDEESIREGLCDVLAYHGHQPTAEGSGETGLARALSTRFDLVVLDIMLPGLSGLDVCARLREKQPWVPVLMLTAKGSEEDIVAGLRQGADDYVTKPFSVRELMARIEALMRRAHGTRTATLSFPFGPWQIDSGTLEARAGEQRVALSPREVEILALLAREAGRVVSRRTLLVEVWGLNNVDEIETRTVDVHLAKLRKKIDVLGGVLIETVRGAGYRALVASP